MKRHIVIAILAALSFTACSTTGTAPSVAQTYQAPTQAKMDAFTPVMTKVALSTRDNPKYTKMTIKPEDKEWFKTLMYRLWDRQITRSQFVSEGVSKYPGHEYEFNFIANGFQKYS